MQQKHNHSKGEIAMVGNTEQETHDLILLLENRMESNYLREHSKYHIYCILADLD